MAPLSEDFTDLVLLANPALSTVWAIDTLSGAKEDVTTRVNRVLDAYAVLHSQITLLHAVVAAARLVADEERWSAVHGIDEDESWTIDYPNIADLALLRDALAALEAPNNG